ncbi:DUF6634 family protein [Salinarimonas soli]|uniref:Uncharacterized protein n=1 Tax=Salinarimonas soli TaxID=1638099 RepID=A0A5B2VA56_9HYPH|nr:DUF6634 family protein [Salinarimonas soli]KAA2235874.1 hypothetical protein F0L46_17700 [Salinarimonas soli]
MRQQRPARWRLSGSAWYNTRLHQILTLRKPDAVTAPGLRRRIFRRHPIDQKPTPAFLGAGGRSYASQAAIIAACDPEIGASVIVRVTVPGEPRLDLGGLLPGHVAFVPATAAAPSVAGVDVDLALSATLGKSRNVVLDLPITLLADHGLRERISTPVLTVGPSNLDMRLARAVLRDPGLMTTTERTTLVDGNGRDLPSPPWILGMGRSGGWRDAEILARELRAADDDEVGPAWPQRVLPVVLPELSREEIESLATGWPLPRADQACHRLGVVLRAVARDPYAPGLTLSDVAEAGLPAQADDRWTPGRLYDLADDLVGIAADSRPTPDDLAAAPILENWSPALRAVRSISGEVHGHPSYRPGAVINSSEVYASDGATWVRTYSRWYRLGRPAAASVSPQTAN